MKRLLRPLFTEKATMWILGILSVVTFFSNVFDDSRITGICGLACMPWLMRIFYLPTPKKTK